MQLETEAQGDQVGNNLSYLVGGGFQTILPWAFTKSLLYNSVLQIPTSPTFALDRKYERRVDQDAVSLKTFPNSDEEDMAVSVDFEKPTRKVS